MTKILSKTEFKTLKAELKSDLETQLYNWRAEYGKALKKHDEERMSECISYIGLIKRQIVYYGVY